MFISFLVCVFFFLNKISDWVDVYSAPHVHRHANYTLLFSYSQVIFHRLGFPANSSLSMKWNLKLRCFFLPSSFSNWWGRILFLSWPIHSKRKREGEEQKNRFCYGQMPKLKFTMKNDGPSPTIIRSKNNGQIDGDCERKSERHRARVEHCDWIWY